MSQCVITVHLYPKFVSHICETFLDLSYLNLFFRGVMILICVSPSQLSFLAYCNMLAHNRIVIESVVRIQLTS